MNVYFEYSFPRYFFFSVLSVSFFEGKPLLSLFHRIQLESIQPNPTTVKCPNHAICFMNCNFQTHRQRIVIALSSTWISVIFTFLFYSHFFFFRKGYVWSSRDIISPHLPTLFFFFFSEFYKVMYEVGEVFLISARFNNCQSSDLLKHMN